MINTYKNIIQLANLAHQGVFMTKRESEAWKQHLHEEWKKTKTMPRKMKKQRRKEINLDWSFADYTDIVIDTYSLISELTNMKEGEIK